MVIITAGMIGVGKTTLTGKIAKHLGSHPYFEPVGDNPVLPLYYQNPKQYGFLLQIFFLNKRFKMIKKALVNDHNVLDRSIYEDAIFTQQNHADGNISDQALSVYMELFDHMRADLQSMPKQHPDLMVYADADFDTVLERIKKRGREYEQFDNNPELKDYYYRLWQRYQTWYQEYDASPKIKIDLKKYDLTKPGNQEAVLAQIDAAIQKFHI